MRKEVTKKQKDKSFLVTEIISSHNSSLSLPLPPSTQPPNHALDDFCKILNIEKLIKDGLNPPTSPVPHPPPLGIVGCY